MSITQQLRDLYATHPIVMQAADEIEQREGNHMNVPVKADIMESVIVKGDLSKLTSEERVRYYNETCHSLGLNPLTRPFEYVNLGGRTVLYARRDCADQLRKIHNVSVEIVSQRVVGDILTVHARAKLPDGRSDEDFGSVYYPETLKGEARANAEMKAVTKSKRRVTLSICGLGWLSEEEIDDIPVMAHRRPPPPAPNAMIAPHPLSQQGAGDPETGELPADSAEQRVAPEQAAPPDGPPPDGAALPLEDLAREAAMRGEAAFKAFYKTRNAQERKLLNEMGEELRGLMA